MSICITQINTQDVRYKAVLALREKVLRLPLGLELSALDTQDDENQFIIIATKENTLVACVLLQPFNTTVKLRQMAVDSAFQKIGIGALLLMEAEKVALSKGFNDIILHARVHAMDFYKKAGYSTEGTVFNDLGIAHIKMKKTL